MTIHEAIEQLKSLLAHCKTMRESGEVWVRDCEALDVAIAVLSGTYRDDSSQKIITNADHIKTMTNNELAYFLRHKCGYGQCPPETGECYDDCTDCWEMWLSKEIRMED